jgi:hypothetical protein
MYYSFLNSDLILNFVIIHNAFIIGVLFWSLNGWKYHGSNLIIQNLKPY